jgi:glucoamylase
MDCTVVPTRNPDAEELIDWVLKRAVSSGALSEQVSPIDSSPVGVTPLVWSHAELINTLLDLQN